MNYWERAALLREIAIQEGAGYTAAQMLRLYDEALEDIETEIKKIQTNFQRRYGIDNKTASYFLTAAQEEENLKTLVKLLDEAPDAKAREDILEYIHRDGLSVRAYAARTERYKALEKAIYTRIKKLVIPSVSLLSERLQRTYKESYYGAIDDTAKGLNIGINFAMINDRAVKEATEAKWHGSRFSERIWKNTDRLAERAQDLVVKSIISGESWTKTTAKLAAEFEVEKFNAATLVHTEAAHIHAQADLKAYADLDVEEYKYLATLDDRTCERCQALDGMVFKVSDARAGENFPTLHPRCRCTTTMNMEYKSRRARNPLTEKTELINGNMTYAEWKESLSPEQKAALELSQKKNSRKTADKLQHKQYMDVLGTKNVPRAFDKFQDLKYNKSEDYANLKKSYSTIREIDKKPWSDEFKEKAKQSYYNFKNENIEMSSHAISRFLSRKDGTNGISYTFEDIVNQCKLSANYVQADGRLVKYYNQVAIIYNEKNDTIVSIVNRRNPKTDWRNKK